MKRCELCNSTARMFCESDQASLCWDCDAKVHSANFLVAKHIRSLLCHVCQSPTAWNASGAKLGATVSVCSSCVDGCDGVKENRSVGDESEGDNDYEIDIKGDYDNEEEEEEEGRRMMMMIAWSLVVPLSATPPPPVASCSSSDESSSRLCNGDGAVLSKLLHDRASDIRSNDEFGCASSHRNNSSSSLATAAEWLTRESEAYFFDSLRPLKRLRTEPIRSVVVERGPAGSRAAAIVQSLKRLREQELTTGENASAAIVGICKLSKSTGALDFDSADSR
ncbi:hypothetical protein NMG60_11035505 [Bertholletia excelsa]